MLSGGTKLWGDARGNLLNIGDISVRNQDGKYLMTAVINGQPQEREISKEDYEKFQYSNNVERIFMFDKAYDDVAMMDASGQGQQNQYGNLMAMLGGNGEQDYMSWFLNKNGEGGGLDGGGDILGNLFGMVVAGFMSMMAVFSDDEESQVKQLHEMIDARMSKEDLAKVEKMKHDGVDPGQAQMLSQANAEAGLTANDQQQSQQQQITMRG